MGCETSSFIVFYSFFGLLLAFELAQSFKLYRYRLGINGSLSGGSVIIIRICLPIPYVQAKVQTH
jgi:hypothetical protein